MTNAELAAAYETVIADIKAKRQEMVNRLQERMDNGEDPSALEISIWEVQQLNTTLTNLSIYSAK